MLNIALLFWSGRQDSNLRPPGPKPGALPIAPRPEEIFAYQDSVFLNRRANLVLFFNKNNIFACKNKKIGLLFIKQI